jgi:DNA-binding NarL/FixJ family response regulator
MQVTLKATSQDGHAITLIIADGQEMFRAGICSLIRERMPRVQIVGAARDGNSLLEMVVQHLPKIAMLNVRLPVLNGIDVTRQIVKLSTTKVLLLADEVDCHLAPAAVQAGAMGFIVKESSTDEISAAIDALVNNRVYLSSPAMRHVALSRMRKAGGVVSDAPVDELLTPREREVLRMLAEGKTSKEMGRALKVSPRTIDTYRCHMMKKLRISSTAELTKYAIRQGITSI